MRKNWLQKRRLFVYVHCFKSRGLRYFSDFLVYVDSDCQRILQDNYMWSVCRHPVSKSFHSDMDQTDSYELIIKKKIEHHYIFRLFRVCYWSRDCIIECLPKRYVLFWIWIILQWKDEFNIFFPVIYSNITLF